MKALMKAGWVQVRSSGELIFKKAGSDVLVRVPNHPGKDLKRGTLRAIVKDAGLTTEEFKELL
ncbi:MAG: type II toxin-antitoxin system HicA family toxin [Planctomycetota bacterium]|nr:type II toxin-antitoxin system HicA family toxin [Planctomycetota bacterium]